MDKYTNNYNYNRIIVIFKFCIKCLESIEKRTCTGAFRRQRGLRMEEEVFWDVMEEFATSAGKDIKDMQQI